MTRPLKPARRIIIHSLAPSPPPLPPEALVGLTGSTSAELTDSNEAETPASRDSVIPDSFIRDLRAVVGDPIIPPDAKLPDLESWLEHDVPAAAETHGLSIERLASELQLLTGYLRELYCRSTSRKVHPALDINAPLEDLPVLAPPQLSILRWLWLALLCG